MGRSGNQLHGNVNVSPFPVIYNYITTAGTICLHLNKTQGYVNCAAWWCNGYSAGLANERSRVNPWMFRFQVITLGIGQIVHTCASVTKQ